MADLAQDEFLKRIGAATQPVVRPEPVAAMDVTEDNTPGFESVAGGAGLSLLPASEEELSVIEGQRAASMAARPQQARGGEATQRLMDLGARPGVPLDTKSGVPFRVRLAAEKEPTPREKLMSYRQAFGDENVRVNKYGQVIVATVDEGGRPVDRLTDPLGIDASDAATFLASAPEIAGSILPLIATKGATMGPGVLKALATLALSTGGAELAGGAKDMYQRWLRGDEADVREIAERRSVSGAFGLMTGAAMGAGGFVLGRAISPFNAPGARQLDARAAVDYLNDKFGTGLRLTAAERTGSPLLAAGEALESQKPGSKTAFARFREANQREMDKLRDIATGVMPDTEAAGKRVVESLKTKLAPLEMDVELAARETAEEAAKAIKTKVGAAVDKVTVGRALDIGAKAKKAGFDMVNDANYGAFYGNPKATDKIIGGAPLKKAVDDLLDTLPAVEKQVNVPTGLVNAQGQPIFTQGTRQIPVSTPVRARLEEISMKLEGGKISINDLKQIRTDVDNAIKTGEAVPGVKEGRLKKYYSELTTAIEDGLQQINDPALTKAWRTATDYYKANVGKFERAGIAEMFRDPINAIGPSELVDRALRSPDTYAAYKEFFGAASPQLRGIQQAAKDQTLNLGNLGKSVDAAEFARRLEQLDSASPQLLKDAFGKNAEMLRNEAVAMMRAQGAKVPKEEMDRALAQGTLTAQRLNEMITAETRRAEAYNNTLVRQLSEGTLKPDKIKPTQVVERFVFDKGTEPEHLRQLVDMATPETLEDLRRLTFKKVLDDVTAVERRTGNRTLSGVDLDNALTDQNLVKKLRTVLGEESFGDLTAIRDYLMAGTASQEGFKSAGGLVAGSQINQLLGHGELKAIPQFVKNFMLATVYTSEPIKRALSNDVLRQEGKALVVNTAIASDQWRKALVNTFAGPTAEEVQATIKGHVDQLAIRDPSSTRQGVTRGTGDIPWDQFLRRIGAAAPQPGAAPVGAP